MFPRLQAGVESGEGIESWSARCCALLCPFSLVESGEGIERGSDHQHQHVPAVAVESGEGIERLTASAV